MVLTDNQVQVINEAVRWYKNSSEQIFEISGAAGTGKSVVLHEIINALSLTENDILPVAYTGQAAIVMRTKGFTKAKTIHSTFMHLVEVPIDTKDPFARIDMRLNRARTRREFRPIPVGYYRNIKLIVIDEAYMVPMSLKKIICAHGIKILAAGDINQLPPVEGEPAFLTGYGIHYLTQIMRQSENDPIVYLANRAKQGLPINCGCYGNNVIVLEDTDVTVDMMVKFGINICGTNRTRDIINNKVREAIGCSNLNIPQYGERIICRANNWDVEHDGISLANGLAGIVATPYSIDSFNPKTHTFFINFLPDLVNTPFIEVEVNQEYIQGDFKTRKQIKEIRNSSPAMIRGNLFEYAYAITTHLSQGAEYDAGIYYEEYLRPSIQYQLNYTGITRFKKYMIYCKKANHSFYIHY